MDAIDLRVNGKAVGVAVDPDAPLLYVLRNDLGLKGTRMGCGEGQCMSCTVLVDGLPQTACTTAVGTVAGREIETVESLMDGVSRHPLIDSFIKQQAGQCGYCLAGILMRSKALLTKHGTPAREEIVAAIDKHLCRCGAHTRIIRAIEQAAQSGSVAR
jgi:aerobic-type carbon monoxide dehydrogenase small subunit (CoxS/CutS family)